MPATLIQISGPLFDWVQTLRVWEDSKTFPDSLALRDPAQIAAEFPVFLAIFTAAYPGLPPTCLENPEAWLHSPAAALTGELRQALKAWLLERFALGTPASNPSTATLAVGRTMEEHIETMWTILERDAARPPAGSTLLALPNPYIVAGGRYVESYYWDSYFTALGLAVSGRLQLLAGMVENFASLIRRLGYIPNGTRAYYLGRSQPPYFAAMLELLEAAQGQGAADRYFSELQSEHEFWMDRSRLDEAGAGGGRRTVKVEGGTLNRHWDANQTPRPEGYKEDLHTAQQAGGDSARVYRNLRAAAESGWDFSSRWIAPVEGTEGVERFPLARIHTTDLIPVDLNALLYQQEMLLARLAQRSGAPELAAGYAAQAAERKAALLGLCWNEAAGWFFDYDLAAGRQAEVWSLAGAEALFCRLLDGADPREAAIARQAAQTIQRTFQQEGGVVTSLNATGQQWDWPNGWAPLQWVATIGLLNYGEVKGAQALAARFSGLARAVFARTGKMMEKYDVCDVSRPGGGGEYPNQEGFGWTNGVVTGLIEFLARGQDSLAGKLTRP